MKDVTFHDVAAAVIAGIIVITIAILAVTQTAIPTPLESALGFSLGWLFRGAGSAVGAVRLAPTLPGG